MKTRFFHIFHPPGEKCENLVFSSKFTILQIFPNFAKIQKNVKNCSKHKFKILKSSHSKNSSSTFSRSVTTSSWSPMITTLVHPNFTSWCFDAFERAKVLSHHESMERASNTFVRCSGSSDLFKTRMVLFFAAARQENLCWGALSHWARAWLSEGLKSPTRVLAREGVCVFLLSHVL